MHLAGKGAGIGVGSGFGVQTGGSGDPMKGGELHPRCWSGLTSNRRRDALGGDGVVAYPTPGESPGNMVKLRAGSARLSFI